LPYSLLEGSGFYYNEVSGGLSDSWIALRAIYVASKTESQPITVNPITHITYDRVLVLIQQGQTFPDAIATAQQELQVALGIGVDDLAIAEPGTSLSILGGGTLENAYLFAVSSVLAQAGVNLAGGADQRQFARHHRRRRIPARYVCDRTCARQLARDARLRRRGAGPRRRARSG
jgi:hypothetical protein